MEKTLKIAITGPESSGKSDLTEALAAHFKAPFVKEYAREYLQDIGKHYSEKDVLIIAKKQLYLEQEAISKKAPLVFFDTDAINFKIWFEFYGNQTPSFIEEYIKSRPYNHTLLLYPNTPWVNDGLRKNKNDRKEIFSLFEKHLRAYKHDYSMIYKLNEERKEQAISIVKQILIANHIAI